MDLRETGSKDGRVGPAIKATDHTGWETTVRFPTKAEKSFSSPPRLDSTASTQSLK
jgi:hypothetical protein